jgi:hypothetical protein
VLNALCRATAGPRGGLSVIEQGSFRSAAVSAQRRQQNRMKDARGSVSQYSKL